MSIEQERDPDWHRRWCLHASEHQENLGSEYKWCRRCGAVQKRGEKYKTGANAWKAPTISHFRRLPKDV